MQKETRSVSSIGSYVTESYFSQYTEEFSKYFSMKNKFVIKKEMIRNVLNQSEEVKGIRFMWGLVDEFAPESSRLFLIPCGASSESFGNTHALIFKNGYVDSEGKNSSIEMASIIISNFVRSANREVDSLIYKNITRGSFFGRKTLDGFINQDSHNEIELHLGFKKTNKQIILIFKSFDISKKIYLNDGELCPPNCPEFTPCVATMSVLKNSVEEELEAFRKFRDESLLDLPDGAKYYEMYYFLSPLVSSMIRGSGMNQELFLDELYNERIKPFGELLRQGNHIEALEILNKTLLEWSTEFMIK